MLIVSLIGLKKCGKTTTAEALIREFKSRGLRVGGVKFMPHSSFTIDVKGKDTWRQKEAGADFVISFSKDEIVYMEQRGGNGGEGGGDDGEKAFEKNSPRALNDILKLVPGDTDILICEGLTEDDPQILRVVLARSLDRLHETFEVRGISQSKMGEEGESKKDGPGGPKGWSIEDGTRVRGDTAKVIAFSGIMANEVQQIPDFPLIPVMNATSEDGVMNLADLILTFG